MQVWAEDVSLLVESSPSMWETLGPQKNNNNNNNSQKKMKYPYDENIIQPLKGMKY